MNKTSVDIKQNTNLRLSNQQQTNVKIGYAIRIFFKIFK
jgi:uncharacterized protein YcfL